jgi:death-on-curing protein
VEEPIWLDRLMVDAMHFDQLQQHGGLPGIKDENALDAALARPKHKWVYESATDIFDLAAAYGFALATTHAYSDGNKRIAFMAMYTFLGLNGWEPIAPEPAVVQVTIDVARGALGEAQLAEWLRRNCERFAS